MSIWFIFYWFRRMAIKNPRFEGVSFFFFSRGYSTCIVYAHTHTAIGRFFPVVLCFKKKQKNTEKMNSFCIRSVKQSVQHIRYLLQKIHTYTRAHTHICWMIQVHAANGVYRLFDKLNVFFNCSTRFLFIIFKFYLCVDAWALFGAIQMGAIERSASPLRYGARKREWEKK